MGGFQVPKQKNTHENIQQKQFIDLKAKNYNESDLNQVSEPSLSYFKQQVLRQK